MNTILVVILSGCVWSFVLIYGLKAQTRAEKIKSNPIQNISNVYEEIPVVLFAAPADVVKRMREEFTPSPNRTPKIQQAEEDCKKYLIQQQTKILRDSQGKVQGNPFLWFDTLNRKQRFAIYFEASSQCNDCALVAEYYHKLYYQASIGKTYLILREHKNPDSLEILGVAPIRVVNPGMDKNTEKQIIATQTLTTATLNAEQLKKMPTKVSQKLSDGSELFVNGSIEYTNHVNMYEYLSEFKNNKNRLYNTPEILRGVVFRKLDGTIDAITGLEFHQQKLIQREVLLYEAPEEVVNRFREEYTPTLQKTPALEKAWTLCQFTDSIVAKIERFMIVPQEWIINKDCEMVMNYTKILAEQQQITKVFMICSDVSEGAIPAILGSWTLNVPKNQPFIQKPYPTINYSCLNMEELQTLPTKRVLTVNGQEQFERASIIGAQEKTMDEYFRSVLRYKRYGKVYKANLLTYVPGFYKPIRITDVVEITK